MIKKVFDRYEELSEYAAELIVNQARKKGDLLLGASTGESPLGLYRQLAVAEQEAPGLFGNVRIVQLDEWGGLPPDRPASCAYYLRANLYEPLHIKPSSILGWNGDAEDVEHECVRMQTGLKQAGPIDICILGLGLNGHIAFNEPGPSLESYPHLASLTEDSQQHTMVQSLQSRPAYGLTLGMADIFGSALIILVIHGQKKQAITRRLLSGRVSTDLPASLLWLHPHTLCLITREAHGF
jgi:galactosamine-6-phosphate isomerase